MPIHLTYEYDELVLISGFDDQGRRYDGNLLATGHAEIEASGYNNWYVSGIWIASCDKDDPTPIKLKNAGVEFQLVDLALSRRDSDRIAEKIREEFERDQYDTETDRGFGQAAE